MDTNSPPIEDFERWFYGGERPAGDGVGEFDANNEEVSNCRCTRISTALLERLRASA